MSTPKTNRAAGRFPSAFGVEANDGSPPKADVSATAQKGPFMRGCVWELHAIDRQRPGSRIRVRSLFWCKTQDLCIYLRPDQVSWEIVLWDTLKLLAMSRTV